MRIEIIDDHKLFRVGLKEILHRSREHQIIREYGTAEEYLRSYGETKSDLLFVDIHLEEEHGISLIKKVRELQPNQKIAVLSMNKDEKTVRHAISFGINGYFVKSIDSEELLFGLKKIESGSKYFSTHITEIFLQKIDPANRTEFQSLTEREKQVIQFLVDGYSSQEIAKLMKISKRTIDVYRGNILAKFRFKNTPQLVRYIIENKILP